MTRFQSDAEIMAAALEAAVKGIGRVEPNPAVGAVIVDADRRLIASGFHEAFGGPHAEVNALRAAGDRARGSSLYVTLEPCCHQGKTGPCTDAVIAAGVGRVVVAMVDPNPLVAGRGIRRLQEAGIPVEVGLMERQAQRLVAPFAKRVTRQLPYVHAKWAMTLDGKIAARTGHSQWISGPESREVVHRLRGRMDGIMVGIGTALADNPKLTARPSGPRMAKRLVIDPALRLPLDAELARTARDVPTWIACRMDPPQEAMKALTDHGVEVLPMLEPVDSGFAPLEGLFRELSCRGLTNILVEGGSGLLGSLFDHGLVDECHVFLAMKLVGGSQAFTPVGGLGRDRVPEFASLEEVAIERTGPDLWIHGYVAREPET